MKNRVKEIREEIGWTQERLAKESGVSRFTIVMIENDEDRPIKSTTMKKIVNALQRPVTEIFFDLDVV